MTKEDFELLSKLTILIPTYNRPLELERAIEYWRDIPVTVHILDGSQKPCFPIETLTRNPNTISYHHLPNKSEDGIAQNFADRHNYGLSIVNTEFTAMIGEDDFFLVSGLIKALKILVECEQVDMVMGRNIYFEKNTQPVIWWKAFQCRDLSKIFNSAELIERLKTDPNKKPDGAGIGRTEKWKAIWFVGGKLVFSNRFLNEWFTVQLFLAFCRIEVIDSFIHVRERNKMNFYTFWEEKRSIFDRDEEYKAVCRLYKETFNKIDPLLDEHTLNELALSRADWLFNYLAYKESPKIEKTPLKVHQKLILTLRKYLRNTVLSLPPSVLGLLYLIKPEIRSQIENHTPLIFNEREFFEKLLLKPQEELRLRANI